LSIEQKNRELKEELKIVLNFSRRTIIFTTKLAPQVIVILDLEEEVEIIPQHVVEKQPELVPTSRPMEEEL
jgi:hypothetical protein